MEKKYETKKEGNMLRIIALKDFSDVKKGDEGGLIEKAERNLSQEGNCWVYRDAKVSDCARVWGDAKVKGNAEIKGWAQVYGKAVVCDNARVSKNDKVYENARVGGNARILGHTRVCGNAQVYGQAEIWGGSVQVYGDAEIYENAKITGNITICGQSKICGRVKICSFAQLLNLSGYYIKDYSDYIYLLIKRKLCILFNITAYRSSTVSTPGQNYIENIQTIRQLYGKEV